MTEGLTLSLSIHETYFFILCCFINDLLKCPNDIIFTLE